MELLRALGTFAEPPTTESAQLAALLGFGPLPPEDVWSDLFLFQLYPYASIYLGAEGMLGGEARDRIAGFWRALGQEPPAEPDHLALMLALQARLGELEAKAENPTIQARWHHARRAFLHEHLLSWLPFYLRKTEALAPPFYCRWAALLHEALTIEAETLGPLPDLPLHLRTAPHLDDPHTEDSSPFPAALLSPARSGLLLTRTDLSRAARHLGLGSRIGERRFILEALLGQDAAATLGWLATEARQAAAQHEAESTLSGPAIANWWRDRAEATAGLLEELRRNSSSEIEVS